MTIKSRFKLYKRENINLFLKNFYISKKDNFINKLKKNVIKKKKILIPTHYSKQLKEKRKLKIIYGISNKSYKSYYNKIKNTNVCKITKIINLLEFRFDNLIYRSGFAYTRKDARQLISHKFFNLNNKVLKFPSKIINTGDYISFNYKKNLSIFRLKYFNFIFKKKFFPNWIFINNNKLSFYIKRLPSLNELKFYLNINLGYIL